MADGEVRLTIRVEGPAPIVILHFEMVEEGVQVLERRVEWPSDGQTHVDVLLVAGKGGAIDLALARWRQRYPDKKVEIEDENGNPPPCYL